MTDWPPAAGSEQGALCPAWSPHCQGQLSFQALPCACPHGHWAALLEPEKRGRSRRSRALVLSKLSFPPGPSKQSGTEPFHGRLRLFGCRPRTRPRWGQRFSGLCPPSCSHPAGRFLRSYHPLGLGSSRPPGDLQQTGHERPSIPERKPRARSSGPSRVFWKQREQPGGAGEVPERPPGRWGRATPKPRVGHRGPTSATCSDLWRSFLGAGAGTAVAGPGVPSSRGLRCCGQGEQASACERLAVRRACSSDSDRKPVFPRLPSRSYLKAYGAV